MKLQRNSESSRSSSSTEIDSEDPAVYKPTSQGIHIHLILQQAICSGWLIKHKSPTFAFMKTFKKRYVVLVDRMLYIFKSATPDTYRDFFEITKDTHAYVTDHMAGVHYCIEIRKQGDIVWILQAQDVETMKIWLSTIKRVIACLRTNSTDFISKNRLETLETDHFRPSNQKLTELPPQLPPPKSLLPPIPSVSL